MDTSRKERRVVVKADTALPCPYEAIGLKATRRYTHGCVGTPRWASVIY